MLSLDLSGCQCQSKKSTKGRHFILYRQDSLPLYGQESGIELLIPQEYQGSWMEMFDSLNGMKKAESFEDMKFVEKVVPDPIPRKRGNDFKRANSEATEDKTQMLKEMVVSYMKIVHKTVLDITPKYIIMALVQETLAYIKRDLLGDLMESYESESDKKNLLEPSELEKVQRTALLETLKATREAVDVVTTMAC